MTKFKMTKILIALGIVQGCGTAISRVNSTLSHGADSVADDRQIQVDLTVAYSLKPIDFLIVEENGYALNQDPFGTRLALAHSTFAARVYESSLDFHLAVLDANYQPPTEETDPNADPERILASANPLASMLRFNVVEPSAKTPPPVGEASFLDSNTPQLVSLINARLSLTAARNSKSLRPFAAVRHALVNAATIGNPDNKFLRKGAFLALMFVASSDEKDEQLSAPDMQVFLDTTVGAANWSVSLIAPDATGCIRDDAGHRTTSEKYVKRNAMLNLVKQSGGRFLSICSASYNAFFSDYATTAGGNDFFNVNLSAPALWTSIKMSSHGRPLTGWQYLPGQSVLKAPTFIVNGTPINLTFEKDLGDKPNPITPFGHDILQEHQLSPAEIAFTKTVNPVLQANCNACHGAGGPQTQYVDKYAALIVHKADIIDRINRPTGDAQKMPKGGALSAADIATIVNFLNSSN